MSKTPPLLLTPKDVTSRGGVQRWFEALTDKMLDAMILDVAGEPHRLVEVEFYYHGLGHPDPYTRRDHRLQSCGCWYLNRDTLGVLIEGRGKGLSMSFGSPNTFGAALIRSIETPEGRVINGPGRCVDHIMRQTGVVTITELDRRFGDLRAWHPKQPARLKPTKLPRRQPFFSPRIGLTLEDIERQPSRVDYIMKPYRALNDPKQTKEGQHQLALSLHRRKTSVDDICRIMRCPPALVRGWIDHFDYGRRARSLDPYFGVLMDVEVSCQLHGTWSRLQDR